VSVLESVQCIYWRYIPVPFRIQTEAIENDLGRCMLCIFFQSVGGLYWPFFVCGRCLEGSFISLEVRNELFL
jgi:hypothetical protein